MPPEPTTSRAPTFVALINASALLIVTALVVVEGVRRLINGTPAVRGLPVLIVSLIATAVMAAGVFILGADAGREDLHMRSVLLDTISDALASAAVAVAGGVIYLTGGAVLAGIGCWPPASVTSRIGSPAHGGGFGLLAESPMFVVFLA
ncbi:MAG: hypothetical protein NVSMB57_13340 [Actinomycetota bacterium]